MDFKILLAIASVGCLIGSTRAVWCGLCQRDKCPRGNLTLSNCPYGVTKDICGCCDVCSKGPGETCGGVWSMLGECGPEYTCVPTSETKLQGPFIIGKCEKKKKI